MSLQTITIDILWNMRKMECLYHEIMLIQAISGFIWSKAFWKKTTHSFVLIFHPCFVAFCCHRKRGRGTHLEGLVLRSVLGSFRYFRFRWQPFTQFRYPYKRLMHSASDYGHLKDDYLREDHPESRVTENDFKRVNSPVPIFEKLGSTYTKGAGAICWLGRNLLRSLNSHLLTNELL